MSKYVKVAGLNGRVRDSNTGAILNINRNEISQAKLRKKSFQERENRVNKLEEDIEVLKESIKTLTENKDG